MFSLTDVRQAREVLPTAYCFEDCHVLIIRVVAMAKGVQNVTKLPFALKVFFVLPLKGFECIMMCKKGGIQRYGMCHWCCKEVYRRDVREFFLYSRTSAESASVRSTRSVTK